MLAYTLPDVEPLKNFDMNPKLCVIWMIYSAFGKDKPGPLMFFVQHLKKQQIKKLKQNDLECFQNKNGNISEKFMLINK